MIETAIQSEILSCLNQMPEDMQRRVLEYAKSLQAVQGKPASYLLQFAGRIDESNLKLMEKAIQEGCG